jgi:hypothetical protein
VPGDNVELVELNIAAQDYLGVFATMPWRSTSVIVWASLSHKPSSCAI